MAAELVGGAFLNAFLNTLFDKLASLEMVDFIKRLKQSNGPNLQLDKLKIALRSVDALVNHAEERQAADVRVREWANDLKDAMFEAEDILDKITTTITSNLKVETESGTNRVSCCSPASLSKFSKWLNMIIERLKDLVKQKEVLGLRERVNGIPTNTFQTTSLAGKSGIYGNDSHKESIIKLLLADSGAHKISVIPIVGMGGVGKTTLAQVVYNDDTVVEHFDLKVWACVTQEFNVSKLTRTIIEATPISCDELDLNQQQIKLKEFLDNKKFLVVLDDVWNEDYIVWEILRRPFEYGARGSKIIITTRSEIVASTMLTDPIYHVKPLSDDDCWLVFAEHAFEGTELDKYAKLRDIGRNIVKKFGGLPLAAKALGGLLRSKRDEREWEKVLKSDIWDFPGGRSNVLPALMLSYYYLSPHLKRCFAFCSVFPRNYKFSRTELVRLWMAEDLLLPQHSDRNRTMEEVGVEYFKELTSRSFFQQSCKKSIVIHDLMGDLAEFVSGEFTFRSEGLKTHVMSKRTRHLSYSKLKFDDLENIMATFENLRTFLPSQVLRSKSLNNETVSGLLSKLTRLRELSLSNCRSLTVIPDSIGNLMHLRYLDLSSTLISKLPDSTGSLYNLQTLLLTNCSHLAELPFNMGRLTNLRCLDIRGTKLSQMPPHMGRLKNLQTLTDFVQGNRCGSSIKELKELQFLQKKLTISNLQNVARPEDALMADMIGKEKLNELVLKWSGDTNNSEEVRSVLDHLKLPKALTKLTIKGYGSTSFPNWLGGCQFSNLASLCLDNCENCVLLPTLGQLPSLKGLSLTRLPHVVSIRDSFYYTPPDQSEPSCHRNAVRPFRSVQTLRFEDMPQWQEWLPFTEVNENEVEAFPCLQQLYIKKCPKLEGLPYKFPILDRLVISKCEQLVATVPPTIGELQLEHCEKVSVKELPPRLLNLSIGGYDAFEFPSGGVDDRNCSIKNLSIKSCRVICQLPGIGLANSLKSLIVTNCEKIELPMNQCFATLESLCIKFSLGSLKSFILSFIPKLRYLDLEGCQNLQSLSTSWDHLEHFPSLNSIRISNCPNFVSFPEGGLFAPNLTSLVVDKCKNLKSLPHQMNNLLPSLVTLNIWLCPELESLPTGGLPKSLHSLEIHHCGKLFAKRKNWDLQRLPSLRSFGIKGVCKDGESFPEEWLLPSSLTSLHIRKLQNSKCMNGGGIQKLISLETLEIGVCSELQCMPERLPASLSALYIWRCPLLEQRCAGENSEDWPKIAHIPRIRINRRSVRDD